jgi:putative addiction module antidote
MAALKIRKIGNSLGIVLPKDVLAQLNVENGDTLFATPAADGSFRLTPYDPAFEEQMEAAKEGMSQYRNTLRTLAK